MPTFFYETAGRFFLRHPVYRYMNNRRKVFGMSYDSVRILHAINTATSLQGRLPGREFSGEEMFICS